MRGRVIALDVPNGRGPAAALVVDGRLEDLILDPPGASNLLHAGDICAVRVTRKLPKSGAFCEISGGQEGYLKDARSAREGDRILAQVVSLPEPGKAITLTTRLLIKGPRLILTPGAPGVNVSRRIGNDIERTRLVAAVNAARARNTDPARQASVGVIVRSAAKGEEVEVLAKEYDVLSTELSDVSALLTADAGVKNRNAGTALSVALREWVVPRPMAILCAKNLEHTLIGDRTETALPAFFGDARLVEFLRFEPDPFDAAGVHDAIDALRSPDVSILGASMTIEPTRAVVAVDVNTGSDFSPAAGLKTNLAVSRELPRQLRLRGLGGQIVVDFAPMPKKHRRTLDEALKAAFRADPIETTLIGWTSLGLFEIQRKRERRPLHEVF